MILLTLIEKRFLRSSSNLKMEKLEKSYIVFSIYSPHVRRNVTLKTDLWRYKILRKHKEIAHSHLDFIQQVLGKEDDSVLKYRKIRNHNKIAIFKETPFFLPYDRFLKISLQVINEQEAIITTIDAVFNLPVSEMEEIV